MAHMAAEQRLGNVQGLSSFGKAAQLGHAYKGFDLLEFHEILEFE
jgi:hypothetical protein